MPRAELSKTSKYYIPANLYKQCVYFCRQYSDWEKELSAAGDPSGAIRYDKDRVQTSGDYDSTSTIAIRRHIIGKKKKLVDDTIAEVVPAILAPWVLFGVTSDQSFWDLQAKGMPCGRKMYLRLRREFFYALAQKI